jgi:hypothetical protein
LLGVVFVFEPKPAELLFDFLPLWDLPGLDDFWLDELLELPEWLLPVEPLPEVEVEVEGEVVVGAAPEVVVPGVVLVVVGVVVVEVDDVHDSVTDATGPVTGSGIEDRGVPGGTLTVKLSF